jgi:hypothetical protein
VLRCKVVRGQVQCRRHALFVTGNQFALVARVQWMGSKHRCKAQSLVHSKFTALPKISKTLRTHVQEDAEDKHVAFCVWKMASAYFRSSA